MCLMNAYLSTRSNENLLMKNVQRIEAEQKRIALFDLMERKLELEGTIRHVDMTENYLIIERN